MGSGLVRVGKVISINQQTFTDISVQMLRRKLFRELSWVLIVTTVHGHEKTGCHWFPPRKSMKVAALKISNFDDVWGATQPSFSEA